MDGLFTAEWGLCLRDEGIRSEVSTLRFSANTGISREIRAWCCLYEERDWEHWSRKDGLSRMVALYVPGLSWPVVKEEISSDSEMSSEIVKSFQSRNAASVKFARQAIERQTKTRTPVMFGGLNIWTVWQLIGQRRC